MTNRLNSYERKGTVSSDNVEIQNAVQTSSIEDTAQGKAPGGKGVEIDTDRVLRTDQFDEEAFMRDEMEIMMMEPNNENDPQFCEINVNGDYRMLMRNGEPQKLRRYHVAVLAQAKQSRVRQKKIVNPDGSMGFQEENILSLTYPFQVVHDPSPRKGSAWLKQMLGNPA